MSTDHAVDPALILPKTPAQSDYKLHSPTQPARNIGLYENPDKTELMYFKQVGFISIFNDMK